MDVISIILIISSVFCIVSGGYILKTYFYENEFNTILGCFFTVIAVLISLIILVDLVSSDRKEYLNQILQSQNIKTYKFLSDRWVGPGDIIVVKYNFRENFTCYKTFVYTRELDWVEITDSPIYNNEKIRKE